METMTASEIERRRLISTVTDSGFRCRTCGHGVVWGSDGGGCINEGCPNPLRFDFFTDAGKICLQLLDGKRSDRYRPSTTFTPTPVVNLEDLGPLPKDNVNHPEHYTSGGIECIDAIQAALTPEEFRGFLKGNVIKYTWRERKKGGSESLEKARWYINRLLGKV